MAPTTLTIKHPSPTTTAYTITNAPLHSSPLMRLFAFTRHAARTILCVLALFSLCLQLSAWLSSSGHPSSPASTFDILNEQYATFVESSPLAPRTTWILMFLTSVSVLYGATRQEHTTETLLAIRGLGLQTSTSSASYLSAPSTRFIPTSMIQDLFIYEAFRGFEVRFCLGVIVEGEEECVVVFPGLLPRRDLLERVWRGTRGVLWGFNEERIKEKGGLGEHS